MYKKNRDDFIQQLRSIRKQIQSKVNTQTNQSTHIDRIASHRYNLPSLRQEIPQQNQITLKYKAFHFKYDISSSKRKIIKDIPQTACLKISYQNQSQISNDNISEKFDAFYKVNTVKKKQKKNISRYQSRNNGSIRLTSLPTKLKVRATTAQVQQLNFQPHFQKLPQKRQLRKDFHINQAFNHLQNHCKIFKKLDPYLCLCLFKIGYFRELLPGDVFYSIYSDKQCFYILISGLIVLLNQKISFKKHILPGQTFAQQMLFGNNPIRKLLQQAKCVSKSYIMQIKISDYIILSEQSKKLGFIQQFHQFQQFLRKGFTDKNIIRNQSYIQRRIRMSP